MGTIICRHDRLRRQCDECDMSEEIAQLRADLDAMTEQSESYKAMALSAARRVRDIHTIVCGEDDSLSPREQHEAIVDALRGHHALGPWTAAEADLARRIAGDPCVVSKRWPGGSVEHARVVGEEAERAERSHRTLCGDSAQFLMKKAIPWIAAMTERAEKAERELDEAIEDRRQARDDAARAAALLAVRTMERDARPEISRVDARRYIEWRDGFSTHPANVDRLEPVDDALRAHAAGSGKGGS